MGLQANMVDPIRFNVATCAGIGSTMFPVRRLGLVWNAPVAKETRINERFKACPTLAYCTGMVSPCHGKA